MIPAHLATQVRAVVCKRAAACGSLHSDIWHLAPRAGIYNCSSADPTRCGPAQGQLRFGQSYLCITLNSTNMELAAELIQISEVGVYPVCKWISTICCGPR
jgi:hypothetical protein